MSDIQRTSAPSHIDVTLLEPIRWRSWPLAKSPARSAAILLGVAGVGFTAWIVAASGLLAFLAATALLATLWRFLLPVTFGLSEYGVEQWIYGRRVRIPWRAIRRYQICSAGVLLLPYGERSVMAPFRGLYLPWESHCDEVLAYIRHYVRGGDSPQSVAT